MSFKVDANKETSASHATEENNGHEPKMSASHNPANQERRCSWC
jgi:hypothetical protein